MSPNISSFVGDLVAMAQAVEELPKALLRVEELEAHIDHANETIQARELSILDYKSQIERLAGALRNAEVARDDAELRFLEAEEQNANVLSTIRSAQIALGIAVTKLDPHKPQPEPQVQVQPVDPKPESTNVDSWASGPALPDWAQDKAETSLIKPMGQSEPLPTNPAIETTTSVSSNNAPNSDADSTEQSKPSGRYSGKRYYDWPTYIPLNQWLDGGGTQADYDWRPGKIASC